MAFLRHLLFDRIGRGLDSTQHLVPVPLDFQAMKLMRLVQKSKASELIFFCYQTKNAAYQTSQA